MIKREEVQVFGDFMMELGMRDSVEIVDSDVLIIGAGPVGLFGVFECGMLGMRCCVVDALSEVGGQCSALYPDKPIYDIPAYPSISGADLVSQLEEQAGVFEPRYFLGRRADNYEILADGRIQVVCDNGLVFRVGAVILAVGGGAFGANRPPLQGIEAYEGKSVFYLVKRRGDFAGKRIAIAGGGDSAVDWCLSLSEIAEKVYFIHRRDKFRAAPASVDKLWELAKGDKVEMVIPYQLSGLQGSDGVLSGLEVHDLDGATKLLSVDVLLAFFGLASSLGPLQDWGLQIDNGLIPTDPSTQACAVDGIYAIGDGCHYAGKLKLILQGFSEAAVVAHAIFARLHADTPLHFEHSTTKGIPKI